MELSPDVLAIITEFVGPGVDRRSGVRASCQLQQTCTQVHDACVEDVYKAKEQWGYLYQHLRTSAILEDHYRTCRWSIEMPWPRYNKKYPKIK